MAENPGEISVSSQITGGDSEVKVNIKTLDSQIYTFQVNKNAQVSDFKKSVADRTGIPVAQQRLIFRGKVLKDDHLLSDYHIEDGHTLHLVERQPVQSQDTAGASTSENDGSNENHGSDSAPGGPQGRIGQVSHSIVLGSFNIGSEPGENVVPDLNRIVGAVLNSVGIGNVPAHVAPVSVSTSSVSQGTNGQGPTVIPPQTRSQGQSVQGYAANRPFQFMYQPQQFPFAGVLPVPPQAMVMPDSLMTLLDYMSQMELGFSANGSQSYQPAPPTASSSTRGLPTIEELNNVMRRANGLLTGHAATALSTLMEHLEREGATVDPMARAQIQAEAVQVGVAMQHLGSLFLELGRVLMTLRLGQSLAESFVNAGPAVYISSSGPNPLMVQLPMPAHANAFGIPPLPQMVSGNAGPIGAGDVTRNVNIHIHAGSSLASALSSAGSRTNTSDIAVSQAASSRDGVATTRAMPVRNIVASVPARTPAEAASRVLSVLYPVQALVQRANVNVSSGQEVQPAASIVNVVQASSMPLPSPSVTSQNASQTSQSDGFTSSGVVSAMEVGERDSDHSHIMSNEEARVEESQETTCQHALPSNDEHAGADVTVNADMVQLPAAETVDAPSAGMADRKIVVEELKSSTSGMASTSISGTSKDNEDVGRKKNIPLGLGAGGLQLKKRGKAGKKAIEKGQRILQTLLLGSDAMKGHPDTNAPLDQPESSSKDTPLTDEGNNDRQLDVASSVEQLINSPAVGNVLSAMSDQTGLASAGDMRDMLTHLTQNPSVRSMFDQISQHVNGNVLSELVNGMDATGSIDLSRMFQQVMPQVFEFLGSTSTRGEPGLRNVTFPSINEADRYENHNESELHHVAQCLGSGSFPNDLFVRVVEIVGHSLDGDNLDELIEDICQNDDLSEEYLALLKQEIASRKS